MHALYLAFVLCLLGLSYLALILLYSFTLPEVAVLDVFMLLSDILPLFSAAQFSYKYSVFVVPAFLP